ncbi:C40 family peptidase [Clostridium gasigenes]|uniref:C40 family peptidase n=1 Tax=Clostridium gasigenes TaxID=94869 RepID=UPI001C0D60F2|nr:C40 family peptidase [Clostridium gasigenes]MBU3133827.1 C40 family peptidase [Clostridium gasigenes]
MKKRILSAVLAVALVLTSGVTVFATPSQEVIESQNKYEDINKKIENIKSKIYSLNAEIDPLVAKVEENKIKMQDIKDEVENTKKDIETSKIEIAEKEEVLGNRLRELYKSGGQSSYLMILFTADSFSDLINKVDSTSKLVNIDKKVVSELLEKKEKLDQKTALLEQNAKEIATLNEETKKNLDEFEVKRKEQEVLSAEAKIEQDKFDLEYLSVVERSLVQAQFDMINNSQDSSDTLQAAINQLRSIKENQLKSPTVTAEVDIYIEKGKERIYQLEEEAKAKAEAEAEAQAQAYVDTNMPSRGDGGASSGNGSAGSGSGSSSSGNAIVNYAYQYLGRDYVFGATGADTFDCSGLTSFVYRNAAGIEIGRTTWDQAGRGSAVSQAELQPGDLVFTYGLDHVGIYVGNGNYINAPQPGEKVKISPVTSFNSARRIL